MEKVRSWCGQPSDRGRLKNRTESYCIIAAIRIAITLLENSTAWSVWAKDCISGRFVLLYDLTRMHKLNR